MSPVAFVLTILLTSPELVTFEMPYVSGLVLINACPGSLPNGTSVTKSVSAKPPPSEITVLNDI